MANDTVTVTLEAEGGERDELTVPAALIDLLGDGQEPATKVVGDVAMLGLAQQAHGVVHHGQGSPDDDLLAAERETMDQFEERFGRSFAEVTGHDH